jgi:hypothetical protein
MPRSLFFLMAQQPLVGRASLLSSLHYHAQLRHTTLGRAPLDEWSARCRDLYLTTYKREASMTPAGFEPAIQASERPQTHALDRVAKEIGPDRFIPKEVTFCIHWIGDWMGYKVGVGAVKKRTACFCRLWSRNSVVQPVSHSPIDSYTPAPFLSR